MVYVVRLLVLFDGIEQMQGCNNLTRFIRLDVEEAIFFVECKLFYFTLDSLK